MRPHSKIFLALSRLMLLVSVCVAGLAMLVPQAVAQSVTINLGTSAQNYVLTGTGSSTNGGNTYGNYYNTQGSCVTSGSTTTCDLTGNFTSTTSTYASGTYDFKTVFTGSVANAILSQTQNPVGTNEPNDFQYSYFAPSLVMTLTINVAGGGTYTIPLASNQNFAAGLDNINFVYTAAVCGGTSLGSSPCQQDYVGTVAGATYTGTVTGLVAFELPSPPTFSPGGGSYTSAQSVTLAAATSGTTIYYTTDGSTPTASSTKYTSAIAVGSTETINAVAIEADGVASPVSSATYTVAAAETPTAAPTFYPAAGTYTSAQNVSLSDSVSGAVIYYTTDGSTPTTNSTKYTTPIAVSTNETIKAIALASGDTASSVASAAYSIVPNPISENGDWEWVGGLSTDPTTAPLGIYGTMGQASAANQPGGRSFASTWVDASGNFWMFGGLGADSAVGETLLQDLWKYSPSANEWTWVAGNNSAFNTTADYGSYGTEGTASGTNAPPETQEATTWTDHAGNLWMYGGLGLLQGTTSTQAYLNTLWEYSPTSGEWTWVNGQTNSSVFVAPVYGTQGVAAAANTPGGRNQAAGWVDQAGNLWLFGGSLATGLEASSSNPTGAVDGTNDLWMFHIASGQWTWVGGSMVLGQSGTYGTLGQAASGNVPAARAGATTWTDSEGNFWLFGGAAYLGSNTNITQLNDLWKYSPTANQWTWEGGTAASSVGMIATNLNAVASTSTMPGSRMDASGWTDSYGNFWLFGGSGVDTAGNAGNLNDLWIYKPATNVWTKVAGSATIPTGTSGIGAPGVYGTKGVAAQGNTPGGRNGSMAWADKAGDLWLFGGAGADSAGTQFHELNDLWEYHFAAVGAAVAPTVTVTPASTSITSSTALSVQVAVGGSAGTATGSVTLTSGSYTSAATTLSSGSASITIPASSLATGTDTLTVTYTPDAGSTSVYTSGTGTATVTVTSPVTAATPTVTVTPASSSISATQTLSVTVSVIGNELCAAARPRALTLHPHACGTNVPGTGSVVLSSGSYTSSAATLNTNGSATFTIPAGALANGADTLTATYTPDSASSSIFTSATGTAMVTVTSAATAPTVTVTPAAASVTTAQTLAVTIGVSGSACQPQVKSSTKATATPQVCTSAVPTGSVVLSGGGYTSAATALSSGSVTITIPAGALAAGTDTLTATYTPDSGSSSTYTTAMGTASVSVTTAVVTAPVAALAPSSLTFTALSGATSAAQTTTLSNTGNAALAITGITITGSNASSFAQTNTCGSSVAAGSSCTISITFAPTSAASLSATLSVADNASGSPQTLALSGTGTAPPSFTLASTTPSATITPTTSATYALVVTPQNGSFSSPVSFTVSGLPSGYVASFRPITVTPGSSAANTTMTVRAGTPVISAIRMLSLPTLALVGFVLWPGKRRRRLFLCAAGFLSIAITGTLSGCGGGFNFIPASKTYTLTITATGGGETQTTTVQLTVQQQETL